MKIVNILKSRPRSFSFEFFPPKTDEDAAQLLKTAETLRALDPAYISVTWGAGGSTRRKTIDVVCALKEKLKVESMAHLTCVGSSREEIDGILEELKSRGVKNILALRGDPPRGETVFVPHPDGFRHADELVAHIRGNHDFCLAAAGYPEGHPETPDKRKDLENLKRKVDAGVDFIITQLFFDNEDFFRFRDSAHAAGIRRPILPGIMPVTNVSQLKKFTSLCGAKIPVVLLNILDPLQNDPEAVIRAGIDYASRQCSELLNGGAPGIHFYTLNRSRSSTEVLKNITSKNLAPTKTN